MQGGAQVNVLRHNCTSLPPKKKQDSMKPNPQKRESTAAAKAVTSTAVIQQESKPVY